MFYSVTAAAPTATHQHFEPRIAAIIVNGALANQTPKITNLPNNESGRIFATGGKSMATQ